MDGDERALLARSVGHAAATLSGTALDAALVDMGWHEAVSVSPATAVSILFERQGFELATSSALPVLVGCALELDRASSTGLVLPALGRWDPPGTVDGERLRVDGLGSSSLSAGDGALVVAGGVGPGRMMTVPTAALTLRSARGIDPDFGLVVVTSVGATATSHGVVPPEGWSSAVRLARLAVGHELVGVARRMLDLARTHAVERVQFGQPIGTFQAVRHRLADTLVAVDAADAALHDAWDDGTAETAAMAKALAGRSARTAARHGQQVLAGIGFTTEHPWHRSVRRARLLDELFGNAFTLTRELGVRVTAGRRLPTPVPL